MALGEGPGTTPLDSTALLIERARRGDDSAREALFTRFLPVLREWGHRRLPSRARDLADTEDLVQVTLLRALRRLDEFRPEREGAFLAYLRTILLNAVREEIRRSSRRGTRAEASDDLPDGSRCIVEQVAGRQVLERYERALATLPEAVQHAVLLRIEFGYSYERIAEATGSRSPDAARMTVVRALRALASALDELASD
jgi:RNA polymerase sigma-70 factor (ECF subfamily)